LESVQHKSSSFSSQASFLDSLNPCTLAFKSINQLRADYQEPSPCHQALYHHPWRVPFHELHPQSLNTRGMMSRLIHEDIKSEEEDNDEDPRDEEEEHLEIENSSRRTKAQKSSNMRFANASSERGKAKRKKKLEAKKKIRKLSKAAALSASSSSSSSSSSASSAEIDDDAEELLPPCELSDYVTLQEEVQSLLDSVKPENGNYPLLFRTQFQKLMFRAIRATSPEVCIFGLIVYLSAPFISSPLLTYSAPCSTGCPSTSTSLPWLECSHSFSPAPMFGTACLCVRWLAASSSRRV
jgi:hypothetical protein